jgi:hypothetical protein
MKNPTSGGGFSLLNGAGKSCGRLVKYLSNIKPTNLATSLADRSNQSGKFIKLQSQCKLKDETSEFYQLMGRGHTKASFSRRPSGRIHRKVNSLVQWPASNPTRRSSVTRLTSASRCGVISGSFHLFSTNDGRRCLFDHWGSKCMST